STDNGGAICYKTPPPPSRDLSRSLKFLKEKLVL
ncbi:putative polymorphic outer membrane protein, partial [Chlamydia psittaci 02DC18]